MRGKGAIWFLTITLILVSIYQLSFTFVSYRVKKQAKEYAQKYYGGDYQKEAAYLDSMANEVVYNFLGLKKYTFRDCQQREINLGLDLQGGMNITLQISVEDMIRSLANNSNDSTFLKALELARERETTSNKDFITLFGEAFHELEPNGKLATIFATSPQLKDKISFNSSDQEVLNALRKEVQDAIDNAFNILRTRIDRFGVTQPNIQLLQGKTGRILVELPGVKDEDRVRNLLQRTAKLEFYETYTYKEVYPLLLKADKKLKEILAKEQLMGGDTTTSLPSLATADTAKSLLEEVEQKDTTQQAQTFEEFAKEHPLFALLKPYVDENGNLIRQDYAAVGYALKRDMQKISYYLSLPEIKSLFPRDLKFAWTAKPAFWDKSGTVYELIALKTTRDGGPQLGGDVIVDARHEYNQIKGSAEVTMIMNAQGAQIWAKLTRANIGRQIAIVLDNMVYSYPTVQSEIKGGVSQITGDFTIAEAQDLANVLKSGKLPVQVRIVELEHVGPTLGRESINAGLLSFLIAFIFVLLYMIAYYRGAGLVADVALIVNVFLIMGVLASLGAVLTLPGIAGIVLTIGMSVDANVIIYERIKEELRAGKGLKLAIKDGYNAAYSAILDANITTLLTGIILFTFGHGPIQGFATTLIIGILTSLYTAIFITRLIFDARLEKNKPITFWNKWSKDLLQNTNIDFLGKRKVFYVVSGILVALSILSLAINGLDLGVDFVGGRTYVIRFENQKKVNTVKVAAMVRDELGTMPVVKTYGKDNQIKLITKYKINDADPNVESEVDSLIYVAVKPLLAPNTTLNDFKTQYIQSKQKVGPTIASDIKRAATYSVIFALLVIFLYIFIRFRNWQYGMGATVALTHDSLIVLGVFSAFYKFMPFSLEIDQAFIAAILTVVGYSVNDTVIIFDRIREYLKLHPHRDRYKNMNDALNSTLSRTMNTSLTTFFVLLVIFLFGGEVIRGFIFAMLIGIIVGTYSSLFVATPLVFDTLRRKEKKLEAKKRAEEERRRELQRRKAEEEEEEEEKLSPEEARRRKEKNAQKRKKKKHSKKKKK